MSIRVPEGLLKEARRRGLDVEGLVVRLLSRLLGLDPRGEARAHLELAYRFLKGGEEFLGRGDAVEASEKLYKAAEEAVNASALILGLERVLEGVEARRRWTVTDLERAVRGLSQRVPEARRWWGAANYLHLWGFHEAMLDAESVGARLGDVRKLVEAVSKLLEREARRG